MLGPEELLGAARAWVEGDPDPETANELRALIEASDTEELRERFERPLVFGTAGLRGVVGAGPARMNRAVVIRTTRALGEHLLATEPNARTLPVVIGHDARTSSHTFADAAAGVLSALGIPVRRFEEPVPTPLVAYAVRQLSATSGIVITASHNPAEYNGYKLYASNGIQIVPPTDERIEQRIHTAPAASAIPIAESVRGTAPEAPVPSAISERYLAQIDAVRPKRPAARELEIVYTPLHGVGGKWALAALARAGFSRVTAVASQEQPDGAFPTVRSPNPEEPGALALALALAEERRADLVLANDPDADRLAVAVPNASGVWVPLSGNQIGVLLADFLLERGSFKKPLVVSSMVSTPMIEDVCRSRGAHSERTLTGFKWIWTAGYELSQNAGYTFVFGFEEAIGFSAGNVVRDKDGISAALLFAELTAQCRAEGKTVLERLEALHAEHGLWVSAQRSAVREGAHGAVEIERAVSRLAAAPPTDLAGYPVACVIDYRIGADERPRWLGNTDMIEVSLGDAGRACVRPSGTEPKIKVYVDLRARVTSDRVRIEEPRLRETAGKIGDALIAVLGF